MRNDTNRCYSRPQGAFDPHHSTAKIANKAHQSGLVASCVTRANMMLITMQTSATMFPTPKVMSSPYVGSCVVRAIALAGSQFTDAQTVPFPLLLNFMGQRRKSGTRHLYVMHIASRANLGLG
jgi:hypothetical protein